MRIPMYQIDAFASHLFRGNPAAVCPLDRWLPDETLQAVAAENNLSETAFYVQNGEGRYHLRWFTPAIEVDLCGHATLATAYVILEARREISASRVVFDSKGGELIVDREDGLYALNFPARPPAECTPDPRLISGLGARPQRVLAASDYLCVFETQDQ